MAEIVIQVVLRKASKDWEPQEMGHKVAQARKTHAWRANDPRRGRRAPGVHTASEAPLKPMPTTLVTGEKPRRQQPIINPLPKYVSTSSATNHFAERLPLLLLVVLKKKKQKSQAAISLNSTVSNTTVA